jgi:hypothetical protein
MKNKTISFAASGHVLHSANENPVSWQVHWTSQEDVVALYWVRDGLSLPAST